MDLERRRLAEDPIGWRRWGPYLSERAWGTVREDYSPDGMPWTWFPHDHARSRTYRWNEDGLAGISDDHQHLCFALAFWNCKDPILKERIFGLTGPQGNHGEDAKEYWWYDDSTPTHSFMRWRYLYPIDEFPYDDLVATNASRSRQQPEYELCDTGVLNDDRYWDVAVEYAKAETDDICIKVTVRNASPETARLHVLPTVWFRNVWSWGIDDPRSVKPNLFSSGAADIGIDHGEIGSWHLVGDTPDALLFCDNDTNDERIWGAASMAPFPKDGINDYVVDGKATINPQQRGTKGSFHYILDVAGGQTSTLRLRLHGGAQRSDATGTDFDTVFAARQSEADEFYESLAPQATDDEKLILRQSLAGMLWSKQLFHYNVDRWLDGDPAEPRPPESRLDGRNKDWRHLDNFDIISMPDKWEYPWYAAWDLAFHCISLAHVDPQFAKDQLLLLCREWYMHPNGQLPAYEWNFSDVNPPVHALAALGVFYRDGANDFEFLERIFHKLLINFTWWVNRKDADGNNIFEGGFLGLDNIGPFDRSRPLDGTLIEQADGTAWMATFCLDMLEIALVLAEHDRTYEDVATKFFEHFALVARAINDQDLWDDRDGFYYDVVVANGGSHTPMRVRSLVGLIPLLAVTTLGQGTLSRLDGFAQRFQWFLKNKPGYQDVVGHTHVIGPNEGRLLSIASPDRLKRILNFMLDEDEFLSPYGLRSVSKFHGQHPYYTDVDGVAAFVDYEPGESTTPLFGGNSNWRGPIWFPLNYALITALHRYWRYFGEDFEPNLKAAADDLVERLISLFRNDASGRRPCFGDYEIFQAPGPLHDRLFFNEYFHGDTGAGLGASHQTGWTGLVADLIIEKYRQMSGG